MLATLRTLTTIRIEAGREHAGGEGIVVDLPASSVGEAWPMRSLTGPFTITCLNKKVAVEAYQGGGTRGKDQQDDLMCEPKREGLIKNPTSTE